MGYHKLKHTRLAIVAASILAGSGCSMLGSLLGGGSGGAAQLPPNSIPGLKVPGQTLTELGLDNNEVVSGNLGYRVTPSSDVRGADAGYLYGLFQAPK